MEKNSGDYRPVHFVLYYYLFQYHQTLMSGGTSQNAFANAGQKLNTMLDQGQAVDKRILNKAYEIFIHALNYDIEKAWGCSKCPKELEKAVFLSYPQSSYCPTWTARRGVVPLFPLLLQPWFGWY